MTLYRRSEIWWVKFQYKGIKINETTREKNKNAASQYERLRRNEIEVEIRRQRFGLEPNRTFGQAMVEWVKAGAPESMYSHIRNVRPFLENIPLSDTVQATLKMKQALLAGTERKPDGLNPQTINRRLAVVRTVLNFSYKQLEWIQNPLGAKISPMMMSEKEYARHIYLDDTTVSALLSHVKHDGVQRALLGYAYTGMRRSELLKLKPENWDNGQVILDQSTKGKKPRSIPVPEHARWVFETLPFDVSASQLRYWFELARKKINRPDIRVQDLRHTYASWLAKDPNIPLTVIRDILGHSSLSVTQSYANFSMRRLADDFPDIITHERGL